MPRKIRQIRIEGNIAYVPLTQGYEAVIDAADALSIGRYNWKVRVEKHTAYAQRGVNLSRFGKGWKTVLMHREILQAAHGFEVDHISGDGLDNRRENLRAATKSENVINGRLRAVNKAGLKGASPRNGRWVAQIRHGGKQLWLGMFDTPEAAHAAYCEASARLHGEFGRTA
jgi:hypothetical protein